MATLTRPGVYVDLSSFPTFASTSPGTAAACFVGACPRGPLTPTFVTSWKDFTRSYGGFETAYPPSSLHLAVFSYFSAGGTTAIIVRAYRLDTSGPTVASHSFLDQAPSETTPGTAQPSLKISAANPGQWGNSLYIDILPGTILPSSGTDTVPLSFTVVVKYQGTAPVNIVEQWTNVSLVPGSTNQGENNYTPDIINSPYTGSNFIVVEDLSALNSTPTPVPYNNPAPTVASQELSNGGDGSSLTLTDITTAVESLDQYPDQPFVLNLPGVNDAATLGPVLGYAESRGDVFIVIDPPPSVSNPATVVALAQSIGATAQGAMYYPQVQISDPYSPVSGRTRIIPPGGFVVGQYVATDMSRGVAKAPAGLGTSLLGVTGLEFILTNDSQGILTQGNVNCIISVPGSGVVIWGARTLSPYLATRYVSVERTIIYLQTELVALSKFAVFEPNDYILWNQIASVLSQFLTAFWQSGGLQGQSASDAFYITCDDTINTSATIQQGIVNVEVGVSLQYPAEFVVISIGQWAGGSSASVTTS